ncbi:MAG TPA: transaldolase [Dongiaceae bacterium]|nr:transaldolase [Dongiaceae bacterium]
MNSLQKLSELGQALWLDDLHRDLMTSGKLEHLITADSLRGMTSNPAIFQKAIADHPDYEADIRAAGREGKPVAEIFETLAVKDVQMAAEVFHPLYEKTQGEHGYVSLEVNPHFARDTGRTLQEARRLWQAVNRPNIFIKVPGTAAGLPAISQLISEGININVTLLFGLPRYAAVADAFLTGLEQRLQKGQPVRSVRSVASFFLSRIDVLLDPKLEAVAGQGGGRGTLAAAMRGQVAIAAAQSAYQIYREIKGSERWQQLALNGARPQWLLWASTSTKNPDYSAVKYVEPLIGPDTINTMPMETLEAYRAQGQPQARLEQDVDQARRVMAQLAEVGLDIDAATQQLETEGVEKFCKPFDALMKTLAQEVAAA